MLLLVRDLFCVGFKRFQHMIIWRSSWWTLQVYSFPFAVIQSFLWAAPILISPDTLVSLTSNLYHSGPLIYHHSTLKAVRKSCDFAIKETKRRLEIVHCFLQWSYRIDIFAVIHFDSSSWFTTSLSLLCQTATVSKYVQRKNQWNNWRAGNFCSPKANWVEQGALGLCGTGHWNPVTNLVIDQTTGNHQSNQVVSHSSLHHVNAFASCVSDPRLPPKPTPHALESMTY